MNRKDPREAFTILTEDHPSDCEIIFIEQIRITRDISIHLSGVAWLCSNKASHPPESLGPLPPIDPRVNHLEFISTSNAAATFSIDGLCVERLRHNFAH